MRLNELASEQSDNGDEAHYIVMLTHGSLAREERLVVEDLLKSGELPASWPPRRSSSASTWAPWISRSRWSRPSRSPRPTADRPRRPRRGRGLARPDFPVPRRSARVRAVVARRMRDGDIEPTVVPRNPLDVLAQQIVATAAPARSSRSRRSTRPSAAPTPSPSCRGAARQRPRHAGRALSVGGVRGAAPADRLGPGGGHRFEPGGARSSSRSRTRGRSPTAASTACTCRTAAAWASWTRRWSTRRGRADVPARRVHLADRGDHARPRDRHAGTRRTGRRAVLKGDGIGRPKELGLAIGAFARESVDRDPRSSPASTTWTSERAQPVGLPARAARGHARRAERPHDRRRALPRRDRRLAPVRALTVRRPCALGLGARAVGTHPRRDRARVRRDLVGRRIIVHFPTPTSRRPPTC